MTPGISKRLSSLLLASLVVSLALFGFFGSTATSQSNAAQVTIVPGASTLASHAYSPDMITVVIGVNNTVVWLNNDSVIHTATGTNFTGFNTGNIQPGASASYTFNTAGTYPYHCLIHPTMVGTVVVKGSAVSAASSGGGGIPEFPYQMIAVAVFTALIGASYFLFRHADGQARLGTSEERLT